MAKSKKRGKQPAGSGTGTKQAVRMPAVAPASPGGPNRLARKEEARRQREALRRKMARRRTLRITGAIVAALVVVAAVTVYVLSRPNPAEAAGCGDVRTIAPYPGGNDRAHIGSGSAVTSPPPLLTYSSVPPASGPHDPTPQPAGVYSTPPGIYHVIHSLEHAAVVIWYPPGTQGAELAKIKSFYNDPINQDHVIVSPYDYPDQGAAGKLPSGKQMVLVAWHHMESCSRISLSAAQDFIKHYRLTTGETASTAYKGDAPEPGLSIG
jgi:hypothetical protein